MLEADYNESFNPLGICVESVVCPEVSQESISDSLLIESDLADRREIPETGFCLQYRQLPEQSPVKPESVLFSSEQGHLRIIDGIFAHIGPITILYIGEIRRHQQRRPGKSVMQGWIFQKRSEQIAFQEIEIRSMLLHVECSDFQCAPTSVDRVGFADCGDILHDGERNDPRTGSHVQEDIIRFPADLSDRKPHERFRIESREEDMPIDQEIQEKKLNLLH